MSNEFKLFTKKELASNVVNQFLDKVVRTEMDLEYFKQLEADAPHTSKKREMLQGQVKLLTMKFKEAKKKYVSAKLYLRGLDKENEQTKT